jgi:hypothetical protein
MQVFTKYTAWHDIQPANKNYATSTTYRKFGYFNRTYICFSIKNKDKSQQKIGRKDPHLPPPPPPPPKPPPPSPQPITKYFNSKIFLRNFQLAISGKTYET